MYTFCLKIATDFKSYLKQSLHSIWSNAKAGLSWLIMKNTGLKAPSCLFFYVWEGYVTMGRLLSALHDSSDKSSLVGCQIETPLCLTVRSTWYLELVQAQLGPLSPYSQYSYGSQAPLSELLFPVSPPEVWRWGLIWLAWFPLQHGSVHPSYPLSPRPTWFAPEPTPNAPGQGPRHPWARPEVGGGRPRQAEIRMELPCVHRHVLARISPQSCAWAWAFSGETRLRHRTDRPGRCISHISSVSLSLSHHLYVAVPKPSRCWVTSPKVHLDPYWKWKTRPNKRPMLSKSVCPMSYSKTQLSLLLV